VGDTMNKIKYIYNKVTGKQTIVIVVIFLLFTSIVLPYIAGLTTRLIGVSESPDTGFGLTLNDLYFIRSEYGAYGRKVYIIMRYTFDIVWPIVYTSFLVVVFAYLGRNLNLKVGYKILYLPLIAVLFDFLENISATIFMAKYPKQADFFGMMTLSSSMIKWGLIGLCFAGVIVLLVMYIIKKLRNK